MSTTRKQVVTYVDALTHEWLRGEAKRQNRSVSQFLSLMLKRLAEEERSTVREEQ